MPETQKQYSTEELIQMAKALVMLREGVSAFPDVNNGHITGLYLVDIFSAAAWCSKHGIEYEQEYTDQLKGGYPSLVAALSAACDVLHPGEEPDVVVLPVATAKRAKDALQYLANEYRTAAPKWRKKGTGDTADTCEKDAKTIDGHADVIAGALSGKEMNTQS